VAEVLVNRWTAWSHLIPPIPYSLHLANYQVKLLRSYLQDPEVHVKTCRNPRLRSGPFVDLAPERIEEVKAFLAETENGQRENFKLARDFINFHNYLVKEAHGQSLDAYYDKMPGTLRGYVELVYDYYNRPTVRVIESLLYESPYYQKGLQSLRIFQETQDDSRPFFMSTPRLPEAEQLEWDVPFDDARVDELFRLDCSPRPLGYVRELLGLSIGDASPLLSLLTDSPPRVPEKWDGDGIRIRYFGHACVLIEWKGVSILTDPYVGVAPTGGGVERFSYSDLPATIDYVLITHNHHDHFCIEPLLRLRHRIGCLVVPHSSGILYGDPSLKLLARKIGFKNVVEMESLESIPIPDGEIIAAPFLGEHADLAHAKSAYIVRAGQTRILFSADSDCLDKRIYEHLREVVGPIHTLFTGMECVGAPLSWSCGPFFPIKPDFDQEQTRRYKGCDSTRALSIMEAIGARRVYVYAMGLEPWLEYLLGLALSEQSPQIIEAGRLLDVIRGRGLEAKLLFGQDEIHLDTGAAGKSASGKPAGDREAAPAHVSGISDESEDQFIFD
jgi:L-ascorbate metabolism protein UlaG (beta-lactamase superfamily)